MWREASVDDGRFQIEGNITRLECIGEMFEAVIETDGGRRYRYRMDPISRRFWLEPVDGEPLPQPPTGEVTGVVSHRVARHRRCVSRD
jgi:hypothetical protein